MKSPHIMAVAWPAFLVAGLLEMLVFGLVDPQDLQWSGEVLAISRQGIYTLSFFAFWLLAMLSSALSLWLTLSASQVNQAAEGNSEN